MTGENFTRFYAAGGGINKDIKQAKEKLIDFKNDFWDKAKKNEYKADYLKYEKDVEALEYEIYCLEYERDQH